MELIGLALFGALLYFVYARKKHTDHVESEFGYAEGEE